MEKASRPATLSERRAEELRFDIALAARDLFLAEGSTSVTVDRICTAAGIAPRTFHRHFPVKEDVVLPLFRRFGTLSIEMLAHADPHGDVVQALVEAFSTEVPKRGTVEFDRTFMALVVNDPQYRLRWLDWGQDLIGPITEFLAARFDLGNNPNTRELPAQLAIQVCRHAYVRWVADGDFAGLRAALQVGMQMVVGALPILSKQG
ncbi:TetR family transcriptional regulator [Mycolicibacterium peregrinum]|uniref:TetR family transcriptional regulator n=1 Tax=Mycolicibacterium peregrinum TaxID=43304 RepID=A0A1X2B2V0_MYCPR|nr:TetR/AcrR family transcriptional regulator [Mycolicibacterium peregrinum]MCV7200972.1 TetR family transcriptional regulator [Mycolicibacterium peregrinum]ORW57950.1 transcriptional regulator [Mycolicibacterium peregrinum]OWM01020.1 TetR family transcriptional regulator [Mycolicibacterium peregrinum]TGB36766.1 TetR family transcriptional regulator [Mycolicibacterium peregrinum]TGB39121.1 TetR family transcriptional regulator [Mycolicibacterium peregrinum]